MNLNNALTRKSLFRMTLAFIMIMVVFSGVYSVGAEGNATNDIKIYSITPDPESPDGTYEGSGRNDCGRNGRCQQISIINTGSDPYDISGWNFNSSDGWDGYDTATFPSGSTIDPGQVIVVANYATYFEGYWGYKADFEMISFNTDPSVPQMDGPDYIDLDDSEGYLYLRDSSNTIVDTLVYGEDNSNVIGWSGPAVQLWDKFPVRAEKQVIKRRAIEDDYGIVADTNTAEDWGQGSEPNWGRMWHEGQSDFRAAELTGTSADITAVASPDNSGQYVRDLVESANNSLVFAAYKFESDTLADDIVDAMDQGVEVTVFTDRNQCCDNTMPDKAKYVHERIDQHANGEVWYMYNWDGEFSSRYNFMHAKYMIVDSSSVLIGSENFGKTGFNPDNSWGNRGWMAHVKNNNEVVQWYEDLLAEDLDENRNDIRRFDSALDSPPSSFTPDRSITTGDYTPQKTADTFNLSNISIARIVGPDTQMFENDSSVRSAINKSDSSILVNHMSMRKHWGSRNAGDDETNYPNAMIDALKNAADRGVDVRVILGSQFNDGSSWDNEATCNYLNGFNNMDCRLSDESVTGNYLHNKGFVIDGNKTIISSINGTENSNKYARETAMKFGGSTELAQYFTDIFDYDWQFATYGSDDDDDDDDNGGPGGGPPNN